MSPKQPFQAKFSLLLFWAFTLLRNADVKRGVFLLYWLEKGISHQEIGILQSALFWSTLLAEVPTGMLADRLSPRFSLIAGCLLRAANGFGYLLLDGFGPFLLLSCISGVGFSFFSGAEQAYLHDVLSSRNLTQHYARFSARSKAISAFSLASAIVIGGFLSKISFSVVFLVFALTMTLASIIAMSLPSAAHKATQEKAANADVSAADPTPGKEKANPSILGFLKDRSNLPVIYLTLCIALFEGAHTPYFIFSQSVFKQYFSEISSYTILLAGVELLSSFSYVVCERLTSKFKLASVAWFTLGFSALSILSNRLGLLSVACLAFVTTMLLPSLLLVEIEAKIQDSLPDGIRATFFSLRSVVESAMISISYFFLGKAFDQESSHIAVSYLAIWPVLGILAFTLYQALQSRAAVAAPTTAALQS